MVHGRLAVDGGGPLKGFAGPADAQGERPGVGNGDAFGLAFGAGHQELEHLALGLIGLGFGFALCGAAGAADCHIGNPAVRRAAY